MEANTAQDQAWRFVGSVVDERRTPLTPLILDLSVVMAWCFDEERTNQNDRFLHRLGGDGLTIQKVR
jgi:hypothetical protein